MGSGEPGCGVRCDLGPEALLVVLVEDAFHYEIW